MLRLKFLRIQIFLIFLSPLIFQECATLNKYDAAKKVVKFLESVPAITDDPFTEVYQLIDKVFDKIGIGKALNGNAETNQAKVSSPVRVTRPPIESAVYYYNYAIASTCESSLEKWDCYYCKVLGKHIRLITLYVNPYYQTKWFVNVDDKRQEIVLTFRPSFNIATLFVSASVVLTKFDELPDIMIHTGFLKTVSADYDKIVDVLKRLTEWHPKYKLIITGLSLGGNMSSVMTFLLKYRNTLPNTVIELFTYGQSRCGNQAYADYMNNLTIPVARVVQTDDLPARIPPAALGYYHHHNELFILDYGGGNRTVRYCSTEFYESPECAQSRGSGLLLKQPSLHLIDHLSYFGIEASKCVLEAPIEFFLQAVWPLRSLIPVDLLDEIPKFSFDSNIVQDLHYFVTAGIRNLYKVASKSSTYHK